MAKGNGKTMMDRDVETEEIDTTLLTEAPDDWEFDTAVEESPTTIIMEVGDTFVGEYLGIDHVEPVEGGPVFDPFDRLVFRGRDEKPYALNMSYKLKDAFESIAEGTWVKITLVKEIPSKKGNPLKDYKIQVRR